MSQQQQQPSIIINYRGLFGEVKIYKGNIYEIIVNEEHLLTLETNEALPSFVIIDMLQSLISHYKEGTLKQALQVIHSHNSFTVVEEETL